MSSIGIVLRTGTASIYGHSCGHLRPTSWRGTQRATEGKRCIMWKCVPVEGHGRSSILLVGRCWARLLDANAHVVAHGALARADYATAVLLVAIAPDIRRKSKSE